MTPRSGRWRWSSSADDQHAGLTTYPRLQPKQGQYHGPGMARKRSSVGNLRHIPRMYQDRAVVDPQHVWRSPRSWWELGPTATQQLFLIVLDQTGREYLDDTFLTRQYQPAKPPWGALLGGRQDRKSTRLNCSH